MGSILVKGQKLHRIAIVSKSLFSMRSLRKPHKVDIVCLSVCLSVCFISETSGHISLGLLLASAVDYDYLSGRPFDKILGVRSMRGNIFLRSTLHLPRTTNYRHTRQDR